MPDTGRIRLLYIVYGENLLDSGILYSQVAAMLSHLARHCGVAYIRVLCFVNPRLWVFRRAEWHRLRTELARKGIDLRVCWHIAPVRSGWWGIPPLLALSLPVVFLHALLKRFDVVHARSYSAALIAFCAARLAGGAFVFDPRGPLPEEMAMSGNWTPRGFSYKIWKGIERALIRRSDAVIGVTPEFKRHYIQTGAVKAVFVPNRGDLERFSPTGPHPSPNPSPVLIFTGEMEGPWYKPEIVAKHYLQLKAFVPRLQLSVITRAPEAVVVGKLVECGVSPDACIVRSAAPDEMPRWLDCADLGLIFADKPFGVWPVKFAEYLAAGLPVVVDLEVGVHLTHAVRKFRLGVVVDKDDRGSYQGVDLVLGAYGKYVDNCLRYAKHRMNISRSADQYLRLYKQVINAGG